MVLASSETAAEDYSVLAQKDWKLLVIEEGARECISDQWEEQALSCGMQLLLLSNPAA